MFFNKNHILERKDGWLIQKSAAKHITRNLIMYVSRIFRYIEKSEFKIKKLY